MSVPRRGIYRVLTVVFALTICAGALGQEKKFVLVIDPGHGGGDPGAVHGRLSEKDLNLEVALGLGKAIEREMPDVSVLYTRKDDRSVGLAARGDFANRNNADLFLSIHTNSAGATSASGSETFVMGADKSAANLEVAKLENEVIKYEDDYTETYAGFDPSSPELSILFGMLQYAHFESSIAFARLIQKHHAANTPLKDRGAKQGPFAVLWKPTMPRVLVETGFISNESDRRYIFSEAGKQAIVRTLFDAFSEYKAAGSDTAAPPEIAKGSAEESTKESTPAAQYYVQLAATRTPVPIRDRSWGDYRGKVVERREGDWYKYSLGPCSAEEAAKKLDEVRRGRYPGAFTVEIPQPVKQ